MVLVLIAPAEVRACLPGTRFSAFRGSGICAILPPGPQAPRGFESARYTDILEYHYAAAHAPTDRTCVRRTPANRTAVDRRYDYDRAMPG
jgi:hypothetical protein